MPIPAFPELSAAKALPELAAELEKYVNQIRHSGTPVEIAAAADAAADAIERRVGVQLDDAQRTALTAERRFTFNAAADCWPGWCVSSSAADISNLLAGLRLAQRSATLVERLNLDAIRQGTATWLIGAFELALQRLSEASSSFERARQSYADARAPGLVLLMDGYLAIVEHLLSRAGGSDSEKLEQVCVKIQAGGFADGAGWIEQLRTALKVFADGSVGAA